MLDVHHARYQVSFAIQQQRWKWFTPVFDTDQPVNQQTNQLYDYFYISPLKLCLQGFHNN